MKRLSTGLLAALVAAENGETSEPASNSAHADGIIGLNAPSRIAQAPTGAPPADFGTPPSGEVPILFNDRHVYSKPDRLKANRVLAALVRGNTTLRSMRSKCTSNATVSNAHRSSRGQVNDFKSRPGYWRKLLLSVRIRAERKSVKSLVGGASRPFHLSLEVANAFVSAVATWSQYASNVFASSLSLRLLNPLSS